MGARGLLPPPLHVVFVTLSVNNCSYFWKTSTHFQDVNVLQQEIQAYNEVKYVEEKKKKKTCCWFWLICLSVLCSLLLLLPHISHKWEDVSWNETRSYQWSLCRMNRHPSRDIYWWPSEWCLLFMMANKVFGCSSPPASQYPSCCFMTCLGHGARLLETAADLVKLSWTWYIAAVENCSGYRGFLRPDTTAVS